MPRMKRIEGGGEVDRFLYRGRERMEVGGLARVDEKGEGVDMTLGKTVTLQPLRV
jgi:hypothetical protein